jgi:hypothetical protein
MSVNLLSAEMLADLKEAIGEASYERGAVVEQHRRTGSPRWIALHPCSRTHTAPVIFVIEPSTDAVSFLLQSHPIVPLSEVSSRVDMTAAQPGRFFHFE